MATVLENSLDSTTPKSLCDWVRNFRIKKVAMKRRRGGDLRVTAILSTALSRAEAELRRKQNERALRWSEMQSRLYCDENSNNGPFGMVVGSGGIGNQLTTPAYDNSECNASLYSDEMMMSTSSDELDKKRQQIENYWKCELSGLDHFLTSLSGSSNKRIEVEDS